MRVSVVACFRSPSTFKSVIHPNNLPSRDQRREPAGGDPGERVTSADRYRISMNEPLGCCDHRLMFAMSKSQCPPRTPQRAYLGLPPPLHAPPHPENTVTLPRHPLPGPSTSLPTKVLARPHVCAISPHQSRPDFPISPAPLKHTHIRATISYVRGGLQIRPREGPPPAGPETSILKRGRAPSTRRGVPSERPCDVKNMAS